MRSLTALVVCTLAAACGPKKPAEKPQEMGILRGRPEIDPNAPMPGMKASEKPPENPDKAAALEADFEAAVTQACACKDIECVKAVNAGFTAKHKDDELKQPTQKIVDLSNKLGECLKAMQAPPPPGDDDDGDDDGAGGDDDNGGGDDGDDSGGDDDDDSGGDDDEG
ncbi:MAG TPA: hypothetical protein VL172_14340 [Kofleriaceae bacterium]|jgi:hypothetical protein|nr:hypothetical protein [Kofleriaceae bacterium]